MKEKKSYICNPLNVSYRYQFIKNPADGSIDVNREAADPSLIRFQGKYYLFSSMSLSVLVSEDLTEWKRYPLPKELPLYSYAPDARVCGEDVIFCANESERICHFYRTKDILNGPYEKIEGSFAFFDPNLFQDDDGRMYLYWGLSCKEPIYGVELDVKTMRPLGERHELLRGNPFRNGYERVGEDNSTLPCSEQELEARCQAALRGRGMAEGSQIPAYLMELMKDMLRDAPYIEGAWMNKFGGKYYLQYGTPGTHFNVYGDGVYEADAPLGPFVPAKNNPYSFQPGSFFPGAGHGSTLEDKEGRLWHVSTMRISVNHQFERRIGLWPAGLDRDGELFCNQRYGDWPVAMEDLKEDVWAEPAWYLLSYGKKVLASSAADGNGPENAVDENVRTWWQAAGSHPGIYHDQAQDVGRVEEEQADWLMIDLGVVCEVHCVQINFADDKNNVCIPEGYREKICGKENRYIDENSGYTRWTLEGSVSGEGFFTIEDKSEAETDLPHDLIVRESGIMARFLRLKVLELPYGQRACVSGFRVFGKARGSKPEIPVFQAVRISDLDLEVSIEEAVYSTAGLAAETGRALGYLILWGHSPEKLYHSYLTYDRQKRIGALVKGEKYYIRVDAFNEAGITHGITSKEVSNLI